MKNTYMLWFIRMKKVKQNKNAIEVAVAEGKISVTVAMQELIEPFDSEK